MRSRKYKRRRGKKKEPLTPALKVQIALMVLPMIERLIVKLIELLTKD